MRRHRRKMRALRGRYGWSRRARPGSAAYVGQLAGGLSKTMDLLRRAEAGDKRALAALRRRLRAR